MCRLLQMNRCSAHTSRSLICALLLAATTVHAKDHGQAPRLLWNMTSEPRIPYFFVLPEGGSAFSSVQDTTPSPGTSKYLIRRVNPNGSIAWEHIPPEGQGTVLLDAAPDGSAFVVARFLELDNQWMDLLLLDAEGKVVAERKRVSATPMLFIDPRTRDILR